MANKYKAKKITIDGITFDSQVEAKYYETLKDRQSNKEILFFRTQPRYQLQEPFEKGGKKFRRIDYVADFEIHHLDGSIEVIDVKGMETEAFKIKKKLFDHKYPHKLTLVTYIKKFGGWVTLDEAKRLRKEESVLNGKGASTGKLRVAKKSYLGRVRRTRVKKSGEVNDSGKR